MSLLPTSALYSVFCHLLLNLILTGSVPKKALSLYWCPMLDKEMFWPLQDSDPI